MSNPNSDAPTNPQSDSNETNDSTTAPQEGANVVELSGPTRSAAADSNMTIDSKADSKSDSKVDSKADSDPASPSSPPAKEKTSGRRWSVLLFVLLLVSALLNFSLIQERRGLATQSEELEIALDRAMTRIDAETIRANHAEGTLSEVDRNVDNVQERIAELQSALTGLTKATSR